MTFRIAPTRDLSRMQSELDRLFDGFFPRTTNDENVSSWSPRADLQDSDEAYIVELDVPGLTKDDININFHEGVLTVSGERKSETKDEGTDFVRVERRFGHFYRSFTLPKQVQDDAILANYKDGVLKITVPKTEELQPRKIEVK